MSLPSGGRQPDPLIAAAQIMHEWDRQQHHPGLADDLPRKEFQRAKGEIEEDDGVDHEPPTTLDTTTAAISRRRASGV